MRWIEQPDPVYIEKKKISMYNLNDNGGTLYASIYWFEVNRFTGNHKLWGAKLWRTTPTEIIWGNDVEQLKALVLAEMAMFA